MPYEIVKENNKYKVCKKDKSKCFSKKPISLLKAKSQLKAIGISQNDSKYLKLVRLIASSYGYNPKDIKLANDGKHKLIIKHNKENIKFGKHGMKDYILYFLNDGEKVAVQHRKAYLKRSALIKGDWKDNKFSKNNLSRRILWMANEQDIKGGNFEMVESKLNNIGTGNNINVVESNSISDLELKQYLPNAGVIMYPELKNYNDIEELLPNDKSFIIILYLRAPNVGHWVSIKRNKNKIEFFCSYSSAPDEPLGWYSKKINKSLGQDKPYLTNLLKKTKLNVVYNDIDYQKNKDDIVTCGRHVIFNLMNFLDDGMNLIQYYKLMKKLSKLNKMSYDEVVSKYVNLILD